MANFMYLNRSYSEVNFSMASSQGAVLQPLPNAPDQVASPYAQMNTAQPGYYFSPQYAPAKYSSHPRVPDIPTPNKYVLHPLPFVPLLS